MIRFVTKETSLNVRISKTLRADIQALADFHGIKLSSMAHSILVKAVRLEKLTNPELFPAQETEVIRVQKDSFKKEIANGRAHNARKKKAQGKA